MGTRLDDFVNEWRHEPFSWHDNNCLLFIDRAIEFQTGVWVEDLDKLRMRDVRHATVVMGRWMKEHGASDFYEVLDHFLERSPCIPPDGGIVAHVAETPDGTGIACGIVSGDRGIFVDHTGLRFVHLNPDKDRYWRIPDVAT